MDTRTNIVMTGEGLRCFTAKVGMYGGGIPLLPGFLNGRHTKFFIDTGSSLSIIGAQTVKEYGLATTIHPSSCVIKGIGGTVKVLGYIECKLLWDDQFFIQKLVILDHLNAPGAILCGWDFLCNVGCTIDAKNKAVHFNSKTFKLAGTAQNSNEAQGPKIWTANQFYTGMLREITHEPAAFHVNQRKQHQGKTDKQIKENDVRISGVTQGNDKVKENRKTNSGGTKESNQELELGDAEHGMERKKVTRITANNNIQVKPFSRMLVDVNVHVRNNTEKRSQGLFITNVMMTEVEGIAVITGLYSFADNKAKVFVVNLTKGPITINKGDRIAGIEFLEAELEVKDIPECFTAKGQSQEGNESVTKALHESLGAFPVHFSQGKKALKELFTAFPGILPSQSRPIGETAILQHEIKLKPGAIPIRLPAYRIPHARRKVLEEEITGMLRSGIITPSTSEWSSPLLLVPKSDGSFRPVVDFRALNDLTVDECFPVPALEEVLRSIKSNTKIFSSIDLAKGYFQIPLDPNSRHITAFSSSVGHYEFVRLPMGLKSAPLTFARLMTCVLQDLMDDSILSYLDDILICSDSIESHVEKLKSVFGRLENAGLTIKPSKCKFFQERLIFLGHEISSKGIAPNNLKIKAVENFPKPETKKELRAFLGLAGFFRKFLKDFSITAAPLTDLLKDETTWNWQEKQETAFNALKQGLTRAPVLAYPDYEKTFKLYCDASGIGVGATLCQEIEGKLHPIAYASRKLDNTQQKWGITDKEMYAIAWGLKHFRSLIMGYDVQVYTDHKPLKNDLKTNAKDPTGRRARFLVTLQDFKAEINYLPGPRNAAPDALSRIRNGTDGAQLDVQTASPDSMPPTFSNPLQPSKKEMKLLHSFVLFPVDGEPIDPITVEAIKEGLEQSEEYKGIIEAMQNKTDTPTIPHLDTRELRWENDLLVRTAIPKKIKRRKFKPKPQILLPESLVNTALRWAHEGFGHVGFTKVMELIRSKYHFPRMAKRVKSHINACEVCPLSKGKVTTEPPGTYPPPNNVFESMSCDILALPRTENGSQFVVVFIDQFSRYCELRVIPDKTADSIAYAFMNAVIARWGCPVYLTSDNGPEFANNVIVKLCEKLNIKRPKILARRPQANGYVERANSTILKILRTLSEERRNNWDKYLELVQGTINGTFHKAINNTPDYIVTGRDKITPTEAIAGRLQPLYTGDAAEICIRRLREARRQVYKHLINKEAQDKEFREGKRSGKSFKEGQLIFHLKDKTGQITPKLSQRFEGPWRLTKVQRNKLTATCLETGRTHVIHPDTAKPAYEEYTQAREARTSNGNGKSHLTRESIEI